MQTGELIQAIEAELVNSVHSKAITSFIILTCFDEKNILFNLIAKEVGKKVDAKKREALKRQLTNGRSEDREAAINYISNNYGAIQDYLARKDENPFKAIEVAMINSVFKLFFQSTDENLKKYFDGYIAALKNFRTKAEKKAEEVSEKDFTNDSSNSIPLAGLALGAAIGAVVGSHIPGVGTLVGALVGAIIGAIIGLIARLGVSCSRAATVAAKQDKKITGIKSSYLNTSLTFWNKQSSEAATDKVKPVTSVAAVLDALLTLFEQSEDNKSFVINNVITLRS